MSKKSVTEVDIRQLRGDALAQHLVHLNGHQRPIRILHFEAYWLAMVMISLPFMTMIPLLKGVFALGWLGILFETALWAYHAIKYRDAKAYLGLQVWGHQFLRRSLMSNGRPGGDHTRPL